MRHTLSLHLLGRRPPMPSDHSLSPASPPDSRFPSWRLAYEAVLSETDHNALFTRVEAAEAAILTRREDMEQTADDHAEWKALEEALANLTVVKRERLHYDDGHTRRYPECV
jgi:hypothetical protein